MRRTHSGELPSNPSSINPPNVAPPRQGEQPLQQADGVNHGAPVMQAPATPAPPANDPGPHDPAPPFDIDAALPDWEEFAQRLPHTPPAAIRRRASDEEMSASSEDESSIVESSTEESSIVESSTEESSSSSYDETIAERIESKVRPGHDAVMVRRSSVRELGATLAIFKRHPQLTVLRIAPENPDLPFSWPMQEKLIKFFKGEHKIETFCVNKLALSRSMLIETELLIALLQSPRLKSIELDDCDFSEFSDSERKSLIEACKTNVSLQSLHLKNCSSSNGLTHLFDVLARITILEELDLLDTETTLITDSLDQLLQSNLQLKRLAMSPLTLDDMQAIAPLLQTVRENNALEALSLVTSLKRFQARSDLDWIKRLAGLKSLKTLCLPSMNDMMDAVNNVCELVKTLPALTFVQFACLPSVQKNRLVLAQGLQSIPRLTHFGADLSSFHSGATGDADRPVHFSQFLHALGKCPNLTSLKLFRLPSLNILIQFLETHPRITDLHLTLADFYDGKTESKLMTLVKRSSSIRRICFSDEQDFNERKRKFAGELREALAINWRNQRNIGAASQAMHGLLNNPRPDGDQQLFVPHDVTNELASAITRYVPSEKAKAIFDELIVHDPSYRSQ